MGHDPMTLGVNSVGDLSLKPDDAGGKSLKNEGSPFKYCEYN